jgi:hypothetical protein
MGSSGIANNIAATSIGGNNSYTSSITPSLPSYDTLRTNLLNNKFGTSLPQYTTTSSQIVTKDETYRDYGF